jgi:hypothetical protein
MITKIGCAVDGKNCYIIAKQNEMAPIKAVCLLKHYCDYNEARAFFG